MDDGRNSAPTPHPVFERHAYRVELFRTVRRGIKWLALLGIAFCGYLAVDSLAGKTTQVSGSLTYAVSAGKALPWVLTALAFIWAINEQRLRRQKTRTMAHRIKSLETRLDPNVSSSGLTLDGETPPEEARTEI